MLWETSADACDVRICVSVKCSRKVKHKENVHRKRPNPELPGGVELESSEWHVAQQVCPAFDGTSEFSDTVVGVFAAAKGRSLFRRVTTTGVAAA